MRATRGSAWAWAAVAAFALVAAAAGTDPSDAEATSPTAADGNSSSEPTTTAPPMANSTSDPSTTAASSVTTTSTADSCAAHIGNCTACLDAGCAYSKYEDLITGECARECRSSRCYAKRTFIPGGGGHGHESVDPGQWRPIASACPGSDGGGGGGDNGQFKTPSNHGGADADNGVNMHDSYAVVLGSVFGAIAVIVSVLLFVFIRVKESGALSLLLTGSSERHGANGQPEESELTARLLFDGRDSTDVPLLADNEFGCEIDLSQTALPVDAFEPPGVVSGSNRLWAPISPASPASPAEPSVAAWRNASRTSSLNGSTASDRPPSAVRPPSVTGSILAAAEDVPF